MGRAVGCDLYGYGRSPGEESYRPELTRVVDRKGVKRNAATKFIILGSQKDRKRHERNGRREKSRSESSSLQGMPGSVEVCHPELRGLERIGRKESRRQDKTCRVDTKRHERTGAEQNSQKEEK
jgi:hypothetical protein